MNRYFTILLYLLSIIFPYNNLLAQSKVQNFYHKADSIDLGIEHFKNSNDSIAISYLIPLLQDTTKLSTQELIKVKLAMQLYYANNSKEKYNLFELESLVKQYVNSDSLKIASLHRLSFDLMGLDKNNEAISFIEQALVIDGIEKSIYYIPLLLNQAHIYEKSKEYNNSMEIYNIVFNLKDIEKYHLYNRALQNAARFYNAIGNHKEAIKYIKSAIKATSHNDIDIYAELLSDLANFYFKSNNIVKSIHNQEKVVNLRRNATKIEDKWKLAISLSNLIYYYEQNNDSIKSFHLKHELIDDNYPLNSRRTYIYVYELSYYYYKKGNIEKAINYGSKAVELFENIKDNYIDDYINLVCYLRDIYAEISDYEHAIIYQKKYIDTFINKDSEYATAIALLAQYYDLKSELEDDKNIAIELLEEAIAIRGKIDGITSEPYLRSKFNLGSILLNINRYNESIKEFEYFIKNSNENSSDYNLGIKFLAEAYHRHGNNTQAINLIKELRERSLTNNDSKNYIDATFDLANYDLNINNIDEYINNCLSLIDAINDNRLYINGLMTIGVLYDRLGNHERAIAYTKKALNLEEKHFGQYRRNYIACSTRLFGSYLNAEMYKEADSLSLKTLHIAKRISHSQYIDILNNRSIVLSHLGRHNESIECLTKVVELFKKLHGNDSPLYATACHNLGIQYSYIGNDSIAFVFLKTALNIRKQYYNDNPLDYLSTLRNIIHSCILLDIDGEVYAKDIVNTTMDYYKNIKNSPYKKELYETIVKKSLDYLVLNSVKRTEDIYNYILFIKDFLLRIQSKTEYMQNSVVSWNDIKNNLNYNDIAIEFINYSKNCNYNNWSYDALVIKANWEKPKLIHLFDFNYSELTEEQLYNNIINIWEPIKPYISPNDNIYFAPTGILHNIYPIESLFYINDFDNDWILSPSKWVIMSDVYNMHRLSSTRELVKEKKEMKYTKAALYGGLNYDMTDDELLSASQTYTKDASTEYFVSRDLLEDSIRGYKWDNLSNTQQEIDYISDLMKKNQITTQIYKGNKGNEESFKALSGHEYNIIHLATHGFFYPDDEAKEKDYFKPMLLNDHYQKFNEVDMSMWRSGLVLSGGNRAWKGDSIPDTVEDGILKAQEIGDLDLRGADLVVLSACNTGQGEVTGEGVFGLQRAFKMAGAQTIVMSLTPVDDQTTMAMMNKFYTNLFSGQSKHDAFYNAQRYIRSIKPDPKYWMGWIMLD